MKSISMKLSTAKALASILLAMKINRIADKEAKAVITKDYLAIRRAVKDADSDRDELAKKFREDWDAEMDKPVKSDAFRKAEAEANASIVELYEKEAEIDLSPVPSELLYDPELWGENDTLGQIANSVDFLVANGVAEE